MTLIELLFFTLALVAGAVTATYAYSAWGMWGLVGGFLVGALSFVGLMELIAGAFPVKRPLCTCGQCGVDDFVYKRAGDGPPIRLYACGRMYREGDDRRLHLVSKEPEVRSDQAPSQRDEG